MDACTQWLADDFLTRVGFRITPRSDGRRTATRDGLTYVLPAGCGHDADWCPPHVTPAPGREIGEVA